MIHNYPTYDVDYDPWSQDGTISLARYVIEEEKTEDLNLFGEDGRRLQIRHKKSPIGFVQFD